MIYYMRITTKEQIVGYVLQESLEDISFYQINENSAQEEISIAGKTVIDVLCSPIRAGSEDVMELNSLVLIKMMESMLIKLAGKEKSCYAW